MGIIFAIVVPLWLIGIILIVRQWKRDCETIGRENLAVSLWERIQAFIICFVFSVIVGLFTANGHEVTAGIFEESESNEIYSWSIRWLYQMETEKEITSFIREVIEWVFI